MRCLYLDLSGYAPLWFDDETVCENNHQLMWLTQGLAECWSLKLDLALKDGIFQGPCKGHRRSKTKTFKHRPRKQLLICLKPA